jgi:hypothetical protein
LLKELPETKFGSLWRWGEDASEEDLDLAARGLIAAADSQERLAHLRIFGRRRFSLDPRAVLALVGVEEDRIRLAAVKALTQVTHPDVRALAFRLVETQDPARGGAIGLLASNYVDGDHAVVLRWFEGEEDRDIRHSMGRDLINYWKRYPEGDAEALMPRALYEKGPCSFCRESAVAELLERGALTDDLRAECAWDANDRIRELVNPGIPRTVP